MPEQTRIAAFDNDGTTHPDLTAKAGHNGMLDQDTFLFLRGQLKKADAVMQAAKDARKKIRNHLENSGITLEDLDEANKEAEEEPETVRARWERKAQYARWMGLPIGTQVNFFDALTASQTEANLSTVAYNDGYKHGITGVTADTQKWLPETPEGMRYAEGWADGQRVLQDKFLQLNEDMAEAEKSAEQKAKEKEDAKVAKAKAKADKAQEKADAARAKAEGMTQE